MHPQKIDRINELARKKKAEGLSPEEIEEHEGLRREYIDEYRENMRKMLENVVIQDENGNRRPLRRKQQGPEN